MRRAVHIGHVVRVSVIVGTTPLRHWLGEVLHLRREGEEGGREGGGGREGERERG